MQAIDNAELISTKLQLWMPSLSVKKKKKKKKISKTRAISISQLLGQRHSMEALLKLQVGLSRWR